MLEPRLLLLLAFSAAACAKSYFFVTGPNVFRFNHEEDVLVSIVDARNQEVSVWLEYNDRSFSLKSIVVPDENQPVKIKMKVTDEDIFADHRRAASVKLVASCMSERKESEILINYNSGYLITQLDKPLYSPGQTVYYRVLDLDESLKRNKGAQLAIDIIDAGNRTVRHTKPSTTVQQFIVGSYKIPLYADLGLWTVRAFYMGNYTTETRTTFSVEEYVLPTFGVKVTINAKYIDQNTDVLTAVVEARYVYAKPVDGSVGLELFLRNDVKGLRQSVMKMERNDLQNGKAAFNMVMETLLNSTVLPKDVEKTHFPPNGYSLEVVADVFEYVTGKEETGFTDVMFTDTPYIFKFSKSKDSYNPGFYYYLKMEVFFANGDRVPHGIVEIKMKGALDNEEILELGQIEEGTVVRAFKTPSLPQTIEFQVLFDNVESEKFSVNPYKGSGQLRVEVFQNTLGTEIHVVGNNGGGPTYSDLTLMIIARGGTKWIKQSKLSHELSEVLDEELLERIAPVARVVAFYVIKTTGEVVSDSVRLDVPQNCHGLRLISETGKASRPGRVSKIGLEGEPLMFVGLNVIDSALPLLHDDITFKKDMMFRMLDDHDLGCGAGGGFSSEDVFKRAGVTVLTNANINNIERESLACGGHARRKRAFDDESDYERDIRNWNDDLDIYERKWFPESWHFDQVMLNENGSAEPVLPLPSSITTWHIQAIGFLEGSGICIAEPLDTVSFRGFFIQADLPYRVARLETVYVKMTVFNYFREQLEVHAYIEGQENLCSSARVGKHSSKQEAIIMGNGAISFNFPILPLKAGKYDIKLTAFGRSDEMMPFTDAVVKQLNVLNEGKPVSKTITVCLNPVNETTECENSKEVKEVIRSGNEKIIMVQLATPRNAIAGTGQAVGFITSKSLTDIAAFSISIPKNLIRRPYGDGETTAAFLAHNVFAMSYGRQARQMTMVLEVYGTRNIRQGIERQLRFRHHDFAYAVWMSRGPSTWLTAFVVKVFCQTSKVVDGSVDENLHITPTLEYLLSKHNNGKFYDPHPVIHRSMIGQLREEDPSLTAFVLISLMECDVQTAEMKQTKLKAVKYLEEKVTSTEHMSNPYLLAITTYALGLADSETKWKFMDLLKSAAQRDGKKLYWSDQAGAGSVEATSYALLAYLNFQMVEESAPIVRWLVEQWQEKGAFRATQDIVVGFQALTEYKIRIDTTGPILKVTFTGQDIQTKTVEITSENAQIVQYVEGLYGGNGMTELVVRVVGPGESVLSIDFKYNIQDEPCPFNVTDIIIEPITEMEVLDDIIPYERYCDVCGKCDDYIYYYDSIYRPDRNSSNTHCVRFEVSSDVETDMVIVRVDLQSGVSVIKDDLEKLLADQSTITRHETLSDGKGYVIFYLNSIGPNPVKFTFRVYDDFTGDPNTRQMAEAKIYKYYYPDHTCSKFYGIGAQIEQPLLYECSDDAKNCRCLLELCAENYEDKIKIGMSIRGRPAQHLVRRICYGDKADYAVVVRIMSVTYDPEQLYIRAYGSVIKVIHRGIEDLRRGDEMLFRYRTFCTEPSLVEGQMYYVIAEDGFDIGSNAYVYDLMDTAVVMKKSRTGPISRVMRVFERLMRKGCMF